MPTNKHASFRYRALNQCFTNRGRRKWALDELVKAVTFYLQEGFGADLSVSRRTIQGDINVMRSPRPRGFGAPIVCQQGGYFYNDPNFSIEKIPLGPEEMRLLKEAVALLRQLPGLPQLPALEMLLKRVDGEGQLNSLSPAGIQFETNPAIQGLEWLGAIYQAITDQKVLLVHYSPFTEEPLNILLHPYLLKEWRNRWYIFGRNAEGQLWNLALDRIQGLSDPKEVAFKENDLFDPEIWFDDIVGVTKPNGASTVEIQFETNYLSSRYLKTRPIHSSQQLLHQNDGRYVFRLQVILNPELVNELLRFGNELKVLYPVELQERVLERLSLPQ